MTRDQAEQHLRDRHGGHRPPAWCAEPWPSLGAIPSGTAEEDDPPSGIGAKRRKSRPLQDGILITISDISRVSI
ncbi:hypothetical protein, partial [Streptomyces chiangmaiensis]